MEERASNIKSMEQWKKKERRAKMELQKLLVKDKNKDQVIIIIIIIIVSSSSDRDSIIYIVVCLYVCMIHILGDKEKS